MARRLDVAGYQLADEEAVHALDPEEEVEEGGPRADIASSTLVLPENEVGPRTEHASFELKIQNVRNTKFRLASELFEKLWVSAKTSVSGPGVEYREGGREIAFASRQGMQEFMEKETVEFLEVFSGFCELTFRVSEMGIKAGEGIDGSVVSYGRCWWLTDESTVKDFAWLVTRVLRPRAIHAGTPCTHLSVLGNRDYPESSRQLVDLTIRMAEHQEYRGYLMSIETPKGSLLTKLDEFNKYFKRRKDDIELRHAWRFQETDGCQLNYAYPGADDLGRPLMKSQLWISNFDLSPMELECSGERDGAVVGCSHQHRHVRGGVKLLSGRWTSLASFSGRYTPALAGMYARCLKVALHRARSRSDAECDQSVKKRPRSGLEKVWLEPKTLSVENIRRPVEETISRVPRSVLIMRGKLLRNLEGGSREDAPEASQPETVAEEFQKESAEGSAEERVRLKRLESAAREAAQRWKQYAEAKDWDRVRADLEVYRYSGENVKTDPRREEAYRQKVVEELGFGKDWKEERPFLKEEDVELIRFCLHLKAAGFWLKDTPRTTVRKVMHDTIPTGPPVRTPPHNLKGDDAQWVDDQLEDEVKRGQLERGSSAWGSPPFPTKDAPSHKAKRKRRLVVDYRRVNQRTLRFTYYVRRAADVVSDAMGSAFLTLLDAVTGFNHIVNTRRARQMLAIIARTGQFLPKCLTFGPHNGPEDFAYVVDRIFSPGKKQARRFCKEWLAYVDDLSIRTGRVLDGTVYSDEEYSQRIRNAAKNAKATPQSVEDALANVGFDPHPLGKEAR